jgi:hypothetical protein
MRVRAGFWGWWLLVGLLTHVNDARAEQLLELRLAGPPHAPGDAPDVIVHIPSRLDPKAPIHWLVLLHGYSSCARALMASGAVPCERGRRPQRGYGLARVHEEARSNSLLIVPQLAYLARDSHAPRFEREGGFADFVRELRTLLSARVGTSAPASFSLLAHSAGYAAAAAILADPRNAIDARNLVLFDALYARWDVFARWLKASSDRRLISLHTHDRDTTQGNQRLSALLRGATATRARLRIQAVATPHRDVPERHLPEVLRELFKTD